MQIDFHETEIKAMEAFFRGDSEEGHALQDEFLQKIEKAKSEGEDFCPCKAACKHHGNCFSCVQLHRGHGMHLPHCLQLMLNNRLKAVSELTEHTLVNEVSVPDYLR